MKVTLAWVWVLLAVVAAAAQEQPPTAGIVDQPLTAAAAAWSEQPLIGAPYPADPYYQAQQNELESWYRAFRQDGAEQPPTFYRYRLPKSETVIQVAATFSLPYDAIATLNHLYNNEPLPAGHELLIPSAPGLYIHTAPENDFEQLLHILRVESGEATDRAELLVSFAGQQYRYRFIPAGRFSTTERSAFFNRLFHAPIRNGRVSSLFGARLNPITDLEGFHNGIDIAAPLSTPIRAAQKGRVIGTEIDDPIYGNFITIEHDSRFVTLYAHLESITTTVGERVTISSQIGTVGNTGHSTGPHIHFEIILDGQALDPLNYMYIPRSYLIDGADIFKRIEDSGQ